MAAVITPPGPLLWLSGQRSSVFRFRGLYRREPVGEGQIDSPAVLC